MSLFDTAVLAASGALGGAIYWAARQHGQIFTFLLSALKRR